MIKLNLRDYLQDVIRSLPNSNDNFFGKVVKLINIGDITKSTIESYKLEKAFSNYFTSKDEFLFSLITNDCIKVNKKMLKITTDFSMEKISFNEIPGVGRFIYLVDNLSLKHEHAPVSISKDFKYNLIGEMYYKKYSNKIFIEKIKTFKSRDDKYEIHSIKTDDSIFEFEANKKATKYLESPGTYLFYGNPGTGKSSFIFSDSMKDKKIVVMQANLFCDFSISQIEYLFNIFKPDILLLEEFDKASIKLDSTLLLFERFRQNNFTVVLTANKISKFDPAILRPKRIDKILKFDPPKEEEIKKLIHHFSSNHEFDNKLFDLLKDTNFSHAYIVDLSKKLSNDFSETEEYVKFLRTILKEEVDE